MPNKVASHLDQLFRQLLRGVTVGILLFVVAILLSPFGLPMELIRTDALRLGLSIAGLAAGIAFGGCVFVDLMHPATMELNQENRPKPSLVWCAAVNFAVFVFCSNVFGLR